MSKILILNGNPKPASFCRSLAEAYERGAVERGAKPKIIHLSDLDFDINLKHGYDQIQVLEEDLINLQNEISAADHLALISPVWWGTLPAKLKGLFDRIFLPQFAFAYQGNNPFPKKLLQGKTGTLIFTMDTPIWYYRLIQGDAVVKTVRKPILEFSGIKVGNVLRLGPIVNSTKEAREKWIGKVYNVGRADSRQI